MVQSSLIEELLQPISAGEPCGEDIKFGEQYLNIKAEINKASGGGVGAPDWNLVQTESVALLNTSKDLNLITYAGLCWCRTNQAAGLIAGLELMTGMVERYWEHLHPRKANARKIALKWFQEKFNEQLREIITNDPVLLERGIAACERFKDLIYDHFEDPPANLKSMRNKLQEWLEQNKTKTPPETPVTEKAAAPKSEKNTSAPGQSHVSEPPPHRKSDPPPKIENEPLEEGASMAAIMAHLNDLSRNIYAAEPFNSVACLLRRLGLWNRPNLPHNNGRVTNFPDPPDSRIEALKNMSKNQDWNALYLRCEDLFSDKWYWLDLQYYAAMAAESLGKKDLLEIIESQTKTLDAYLPLLKELSFTGGTAFATNKTKDWLASLGQNSGSGGGAQDETLALISEMRKTSGEFATAMKLAQAATEQSPDRRTAFRQRTKVAAFCLEANQPHWAESLAQALIVEMEEYKLAYWEPKLAATAWQVVLEVTKHFNNDPDYRALEKKAMTQLACLDLAAVGLFPKTAEP